MSEAASPQPTEEEQTQYCSLLMLGCDRDTASKYLGYTASQMEQHLAANAEFLRKALKAEGAAELHQMKNLHDATKDSKQWRASVWWLERRAPARFGRRPTGAITMTEWTRFLAVVADAITVEVTNEGDRQRLISRLAQLVSKTPSTDKIATSVESIDGDDDEEFDL